MASRSLTHKNVKRTHLARHTPTPQPVQAALTATPKQTTFLEAVLSGAYRYLAFGGGIRGTKTFGVLMVLVILCRIFPRSRWAIVRKDLPTLRRNTLPSFEKVRALTGGFVGEVNQSTWTSTCRNGSQIIFFPESLSSDPELDRWKGLEVNGFALEEANELAEKSGNKAIERAGSWVIPPDDEQRAKGITPAQPFPLVLFTFNPCANWPRAWFYSKWKAGTLAAPYYFCPVTLADNPYASEEYKESLKNLPPEEYARFVLGEWEFTDDPDQLIKAEWVWNARNVEPVEGDHKLGVDVARYGDDFTTLARGKGNALIKLTEHHGLPVDRVADYVLIDARERQTPVDGPNVRVDGVGLGAGVVDICRRKGLPVIDVIAGAKPIERKGYLFKFKNLRSQMWWELREKLRQGKWSTALYNGTLPEKLVADLCAPRYTIDKDRVIVVESKDEIKKRLGRSTDYADAVVMMEFDFPPKYQIVTDPNQYPKATR